MGDPAGRRAAQKARTREQIRSTAQALFAQHGFDAVTITDVAATAGVSVQTVFNHFASKEELFFAGRVPWVDGAAAAVRDRAADVPPLRALRDYLIGVVDRFVREAGAQENQRMIEVQEASPALLAHERGLHEQTVAQLAAALAEAWGIPDDGSDGSPGRGRLAADVTASIWLTAVRTILLDLRSGACVADGEASRTALALTSRVLDDLERGLSISAA
jgi:AcrR family transcriptional regulator